MAQSNVLSLNVQTRKPRAVRARQSVRISRRQAFGAAAVGTVALALTALSLTHLSAGIQIVTHSPAWEAWSMAVGIDLGFVALELAQLTTVNDKVARDIRRFVRPAITGTLIGSAALNAFAFGAAATGWMVYPAVVLGVAIPALIYAMTRVGAAMWMGR